MGLGFAALRKTQKTSLWSVYCGSMFYYDRIWRRDDPVYTGLFKAEYKYMKNCLGIEIGHYRVKIAYMEHGDCRPMFPSVWRLKIRRI